MVAVDYILIPWWCEDLQHCKSCPVQGQPIALGCSFSFDMIQLHPSSIILCLHRNSTALLSLGAYTCANLCCSDAELASKDAWWKVPRDAKLNKTFTKVAFLFAMLWSSASGSSTSSWAFTGIHQLKLTMHVTIYVTSPLLIDHLISVLRHLSKDTDTTCSFQKETVILKIKNNYWQHKWSCIYYEGCSIHLRRWSSTRIKQIRLLLNPTAIFLINWEGDQLCAGNYYASLIFSFSNVKLHPFKNYPTRANQN